MITIIIIVITVIISIRAFKDDALMSNMIFHPPAVQKGGWHRLFTYGVVHADYPHHIFNMFTMYFFGMAIERVCKYALGDTTGTACFILLYFSALLVSILPTYFKQNGNSSYYGLGASGAVSAIIFAYVLINPMNFMGILFIPVMLPAFLFGFIFLVISLSLDKKQFGGIKHSAQSTGGIYVILFMVIAFMAFADTNLLRSFVAQIRIDSLSDLIHFGF